MSRILSLMAITLAFAQVSSWHSVGHMTISRIAQLHLEQENGGKDIVSWSEDILKPLASLAQDGRFALTNCATWADRIKDIGWYTMYDWHFFDKVIIASGYKPINTPQDPSYAYSVKWAILEAVSTIASPKASSSNAALARSISLRNLIHFVGDLHQPLHVSSRFSDLHKSGDQGGNDVSIGHHYKNESWNNLHFLWDHMFDQGNQDIDTLESDEQFQEITEFAEGIMELHPYSSLEQQIQEHQSVESWALEGYNIAASEVYNGIIDGEDVPPFYMENGRTLTKKLVALAGYRLAQILKLAHGQSAVYEHRNKAILIE